MSFSCLCVSVSTSTVSTAPKAKPLFRGSREPCGGSTTLSVGGGRRVGRGSVVNSGVTPPRLSRRSQTRLGENLYKFVKLQNKNFSF